MCGEASFTIEGEPKRVTMCHGKWCQSRAGYAFAAEVEFDSSQINIV